MNLQRILKRIRLVIDIPRYYLIAAFGHGVHPLGAARSLYAALHELYWPQEAFQLGLLQPGADARKMKRFMSKARMVAIQRKINPGGWEYVLSDKGVFARWTLAAGLPAPGLAAWCFTNGIGFTPAGRIISTAEEWYRFLEEETPPEFVVKGARSSYGNSVQLLRRVGKEFLRFDGTSLSAPELYGHLRAGRRDDSVIIQERLHNHPDLIRLSGTEALQTARIVTVVGREETVYLVNAFFKPVVGRNEVDNFRSGRTGNLVSPVTLEDGALGPAVTVDPGGGILKVLSHPGTGVVFEGFRLPFWHDACALVRSAAKVFLPVRMVGFDVALTPEGPMLVEGNFWPDPPTFSWPLDKVMATLRNAIGEDLG